MANLKTIEQNIEVVRASFLAKRKVLDSKKHELLNTKAEILKQIHGLDKEIEHIKSQTNRGKKWLIQRIRGSSSTTWRMKSSRVPESSGRRASPTRRSRDWSSSRTSRRDSSNRPSLSRSPDRRSLPSSRIYRRRVSVTRGRRRSSRTRSRSRNKPSSRGSRKPTIGRRGMADLS